MLLAGIAMLVLALGAVLLVLVSGLLGDDEVETNEGPAEPRLDGALIT